MDAKIGTAKKEMDRIECLIDYVMKCDYISDDCKNKEVQRLNDEYLRYAKEYIGIIYSELCNLVD